MRQPRLQELGLARQLNACLRREPSYSSFMSEGRCKLMWRHARLQEPGPRRQLNIALGILLPAPILAQEDEQGRAAAAYHQPLCLSVCPSAAV